MWVVCDQVVGSVVTSVTILCSRGVGGVQHDHDQTSSDDYIYWQLVSWSQYQVLPLTTTVSTPLLSFLHHLKLGMKESSCGHWRLTLIGFDMKMLRIVLLMQPHVAGCAELSRAVCHETGAGNVLCCCRSDNNWDIMRSVTSDMVSAMVWLQCWGWH